MKQPLSTIVTAEVKRIIDERAMQSGRTQSQQVELMIEQAVLYERKWHIGGNNMATYQGKQVQVVRPARKGDEGFDEDIQQVVIKLEDGTEKTVKRTDVQDAGQQQQGGGGQQQR